MSGGRAPPPCASVRTVMTPAAAAASSNAERVTRVGDMSFLVAEERLVVAVVLAHEFEDALPGRIRHAKLPRDLPRRRKDIGILDGQLVVHAAIHPRQPLNGVQILG